MEMVHMVIQKTQIYIYIYMYIYMTDYNKPLYKKHTFSIMLTHGHATLPARRKDTGRIPEGYRKGNRHPLSDPFTDTLKTHE